MKDRLRQILKSELKYMYLVSLISADTNIDKESILSNLEKIKLVKEVAEEDNDNELLDYANKGIEILTRDLGEWE